ncbi:MAG TPA: winged helix-turn-helix transcriptional regulator [Solirubrobacterales bacterium]|jgi:DNA-binding HxlR family transcriptional regulator|nr:winged helix-turn-helix transcriptional regulator [Solirubrobacterales bacterium]
MRAGTHALSLLATPLNVYVLLALAEEPRSLGELGREVGSPPQTTMRGHLRALAEIGVVTKRRRNDFPGSLDYELGPPGRDLLTVIEVLRAWLAAAPEEPLELGTIAAKSSIKALIEGWSTSMLRALAAKPLSLTELDNLLSRLNYPSLERRLAAMRFAGQVEAMPSRGRGTPYAVTGWLRRAVAPLAAAAQWERIHLRGKAAPITDRDAEAALLLAVPLLKLPAELSGCCRLAVEIPAAGERRVAGVLVEVEEGRVASCASRLRGSATAWAVGSASTWLRALLKRETSELEIGGDGALADALVRGMHDELLGLGKARSLP